MSVLNAKFSAALIIVKGLRGSTPPGMLATMALAVTGMVKLMHVGEPETRVTEEKLNKAMKALMENNILIRCVWCPEYMLDTLFEGGELFCRNEVLNIGR